MTRHLILSCLPLLISVPLSFGQEVSMTANQVAEARQADEYFKAANYVEALPLFEDLTRKLPTKAVYAERLAVCLMHKAGTLPAGPEKDALVLRYVSELRLAQSLGDKSELVQIMLDRLKNVTITPSADAPKSEANTLMEAAEMAFAKGDMQSALASYKAAAAANPQLYDAPLFTGDVYFRQTNYEAAGEWFQKAIAINPNRETAYRYWGDALAAAHDMEGARDRYVDAMVAEPYAKAPTLALQRWAKKNADSLSPPSVPDAKPADPAQDTLSEAVARLKAMLPNPDLADLSKLNSENMIEPFLLISAANPGIARDYAAYRAAHRGQLCAYIKDFVLHSTVPQVTQ